MICDEVVKSIPAPDMRAFLKNKETAKAATAASVEAEVTNIDLIGMPVISKENICKLRYLPILVIMFVGEFVYDLYVVSW